MKQSSATIVALAKNIQKDYSQYIYRLAESYAWLSQEKTITHPPLASTNDVWFLLHEIAHAELGHAHYTHDVGLVRSEAEAWQLARDALAPRYGFVIDNDVIEDALDTYRLWLHQRSLCPVCAQTGIQENESTYSCINCRCSWQVNEARQCGLRRTLRNSLTTTTDESALATSPAG